MNSGIAENLIIFGAGASYGSDADGTPPLGADLYDALVKFDPEGWGSIDQKLSEVFRKDFEIGMKKLWDDNPQTIPFRQRAMAAYFFRFRPKPTNLYIRLAELIKSNRWTGALINFNYELLLQASLLWSDLRPCGKKCGGPTNLVEVCMPHGCCNIFVGPQCANARSVMPSGEMVKVWSTHVEVAQSIEECNDYMRSSGRYPPVMSYYEPTKMTHTGTNFIEAERERFVELVENSKAIAIIGLRVRPHDTHIWDHLERTCAKIIYCSGRSAAHEFTAWRDKVRPHKKNVVLPTYFSESFETLCSYVGLDCRDTRE